MFASKNCTTSISEISGEEVIEAVCLTSLQRIGLTIVSCAGFMSFLALVVLAVLVVRNVVRYRRRYPGRKWTLIQRPPDAYVISLCCADALQAVGTFMDVRWVHDGVVKVGSYCRAQGAIQQTGETAVAFATMAIALHTFVVVWFFKGQHNMTAAFCVIALYWLFVVLFVIISATTTHNYFTPDTYWCWVGGQQSLLGDKIGGEYVWLWLTIIVSFMVYIPIYLRRLGYLNVGNRKRDSMPLEDKGDFTRQPKLLVKQQKPAAASLALLAYPVAYTIVVLPVSIVRWATFTGHSIPDAATFFTVFLHDSFGLVNVILLLTTRHGLLMFEDTPTNSQTTQSLPSRLSVTRTVVITRDIDCRRSKSESTDSDSEAWDMVKTGQDV